MKNLHAVWCWEKARRHTARGKGGAGWVELEVGAIVVAALPGQAEPVAEEFVEGVHGGEAGEVDADDDYTAAMDVWYDFVEDYLVLGPG